MAFSALLRAPAAKRQRVAEGAGIKPDIDRTSPLLRRRKTCTIMPARETGSQGQYGNTRPLIRD